MIAQPIVFEIADGVYAANEFGLDAVFLVLGEDRAAAIDTGMGCFDLRALIESLTPLPLPVLPMKESRASCVTEK